jgi:hypothetical protein
MKQYASIIAESDGQRRVVVVVGRTSRLELPVDFAHSLQTREKGLKNP